MKTLFLSNMSKSRRLTSTFFPIKYNDGGGETDGDNVLTNMFKTVAVGGNGGDGGDEGDGG